MIFRVGVPHAGHRYPMRGTPRSGGRQACADSRLEVPHAGHPPFGGQAGVRRLAAGGTPCGAPPVRGAGRRAPTRGWRYPMRGTPPFGGQAGVRRLAGGGTPCGAPPVRGQAAAHPPDRRVCDDGWALARAPFRRPRSARESAGMHTPLLGVGRTRGTQLAVTEPRSITTAPEHVVLPPPTGEFQPPSSHDRADRIATAIVTLVPVVALAVAVPLAWGHVLYFYDVVVFALCYVPTGLGITVGYHRLLTHKAFKTTPAIRAIFTVLGAMAIEGPPIEWVANHRKHHTYSDEDGDPHSPHVNFAGGLTGSLRGLLHAHLGWVFGGGMANEARYAPDLLADRVVRFVDRTFVVWVLSGLAIPSAPGWAIS